jgi:hypothetical protein
MLQERESGQRVFKVVKAPIEQHLLPSALKSLIAYHFYEIDHVSGTIVSPHKLGESAMSPALWANLVDLAYDVLESLSSDGIMINMGRGRAVYLAEAGADQQPQRRLIKRELSRYGYRILPSSNLPEEINALKAHIQADLEQSVFAVHLVGETRGAMVQQSELSVAELQHDIILRHATQHHAFRTFIWIPPHLRITNERQQLFVDKLIETADAQRGMELIQMQLEDFKIIILRQLAYQVRKALGQEAELRQEEPSQKPSVYLMADTRDVTQSAPLASHLLEQGIEVFWIGHDARAAERSRHIEYLNRCDASIIFFEKASKEWLITKMQDVLKAPGLGRRKPKGKNAIFVRLPEQQQIAESICQRFAQYADIEIIHAPSGLSAQLLKNVVPVSSLPV